MFSQILFMSSWLVDGLWYKLIDHHSKFRTHPQHIYTQQFCIFLIINAWIMSKCFIIRNSNSFCFSSGFLALVCRSLTPRSPYQISIQSVHMSFSLIVHCICIPVKRFDPLAVTHIASYFYSSLSHWKIAQCSAKIILLLHKESFLPPPCPCSLSKVPTAIHCTFYRLKTLT